MTHTFVLDFDKDKKKVAPSYKGNKVEIGIDYLDKVYGDKNIYSTPRDLLKFDRAPNSPSFLESELLSQVYVGYSNEHPGTEKLRIGHPNGQLAEWQEFLFSQRLVARFYLILHHVDR